MNYAQKQVEPSKIEERKPIRKNMKEKIDRELFHEWLWENRGRRDVVSMSGFDIARHFGFSKYTPTRLFSEMLAQGKLKKMRGGKFVVIDPALFTSNNEA